MPFNVSLSRMSTVSSWLNRRQWLILSAGLAGLIILYGLLILTRWEHIQQVLSKDVAAILEQRGFKRVTVNMNGRDAILAGSVSSTTARQHVVQLSQNVYGVRQASDTLEIVPLRLPYLILSRSLQDILTVEGELPTTQLVNELISSIKSKIQHSDLINLIQVDPEVADPAWGDQVVELMGETNSLKGMTLRVGAGQFNLGGLLGNEAEYKILMAAVDNKLDRELFRFTNRVGIAPQPRTPSPWSSEHEPVQTVAMIDQAGIVDPVTRRIQQQLAQIEQAASAGAPSDPGKPSHPPKPASEQPTLVLSAEADNVNQNTGESEESDRSTGLIPRPDGADPAVQTALPAQSTAIEQVPIPAGLPSVVSPQAVTIESPEMVDVLERTDSGPVKTVLPEPVGLEGSVLSESEILQQPESIEPVDVLERTDSGPVKTLLPEPVGLEVSVLSESEILQQPESIEPVDFEGSNGSLAEVVPESDQLNQWVISTDNGITTDQGLTAPAVIQVPREDPDWETCQAELDRELAQNRLVFASNSAEMSVDNSTIIQNIGEIVKICADFKITIQGHTDSRGSLKGNLDLSQRRAATVMEALIAQGVLPDRLTPVGYGARFPIATNRTAEGRELNRRIEFVVER